MIYSVSVALPVYNGAQYLIPQLDSILEQLQEQDELVIAYQASEDNSLEILEAYQRRDPRVKVYVNPEKGITSNFNLAIGQCGGDVIFLSDQDDVWLPGKRERCVEALRTSGAQLVIHNAVHTDAELHPQAQTFFEIYPIGPGKWKNIKKPRMSGCCMAFPAAFRDLLLPIPEIYGYDQWVAVLAEFSGTVVYLDEVLLLHRLHGDNSTTSTRKLSVILNCRSRLLIHLFFRLLRGKGKGRSSCATP